MMHGTYIGDNTLLKGKTALIRFHNYRDRSRLVAQFDDPALPLHFTHGWQNFHSSEWKLGDTPTACESCGGTGWHLRSNFGTPYDTVKCFECDGTGAMKWPHDNLDDWPYPGKARDFYLIKSEEEGAQTTEQQMKEAFEVASTSDALKKAGYKELADGTFENRWFKAKITGEKCEAEPTQRKVDYVKKKDAY